MLGNLYLPGLSDVNLSVKDVNQALKWVSQNIGDDSSWCRGLEAALKGSAIPTSEGPVFYCDGKTAADFELAWGGAKVYVMPSGTNTWALAKAAMASAEEAGTYECEYGTYTVYAK